METLNIVLVDDHKIVRDGIASHIIGTENIKIVAEASGGDELFEILKTTKVDIIIVDLFFPQLLGIELIKIVTKQYPKIKILVLSGNTDEDIIMGAFQAGADGYLPKNVEKEELIDVIYSVNKKEQYISNSLAGMLSKNFIKKAKFGDKFSNSKISRLTEREMEVIKLLSESLSYKEIASILDISSRTVEAHKNNILEKLELKTVVDIVKFAIKNKIIEL